MNTIRPNVARAPYDNQNTESEETHSTPREGRQDTMAHEERQTDSSQPLRPVLSTPQSRRKALTSRTPSAAALSGFTLTEQASSQAASLASAQVAPRTADTPQNPAFKAALANPARAAASIKLFGFDVHQRYEIARMAPTQALEHMDDFEFDGEQQLQIAMMDPVAAAQHIYGLRQMTQEQRYTLALHNPVAAAGQLALFKLSAEQTETIALKTPKETMESIWLSALPSDLRYRVALMEPRAAANNITYLSLDPEQAYEIASKAPREAIPRIMWFNLPPERARKIAMLAWDVAIRHVADFNFSPEESFELAQKNPELSMEHIWNFGLSPEQEAVIALPTYLCGSESSQNAPHREEDATRFFDKLFELFRQTPELASFHPWLARWHALDGSKRGMQGVFMGKIISKALRENEPEVLHWANYQGLFEAVSHLRQPSLYDPMTERVGVFSQSPAVRQCYEDLPALRFAKSSKFAPLVNLALARLQADGVDVSPVLAHLTKDYVVYKHAPRARTLLNMLCTIAELQGHTAEEKSRIIARLSDKDSVRQAGIVCGLGRASLLADRDVSTKAVAGQAIGKTLGEDFGERELEQFENTFGKSRNPDAIWQLLASMQSSGESENVQAFKKVFTSVLKGTFIQDRYAIKESPHLKAMQRSDATLIARWSQGLEGPVDPTKVIPGGFDPSDWLAEKILGDNHLGHLLTEPLQKILQTHSGRYFANSDVNTAPLSTQEAAIAAQLNQHCQTLALSESPADVKEAMGSLSRFMAAQGIDCEFRHDVDSQLKELQKTRKPRNDLRVIETDDPDHLLLCGTEVAGSCQRVDGDPHYNKGLLGYLAHGQTRLLAVVQPDGQIVSRAIFRCVQVQQEPGQRPQKWMLFMERVYGDASYKEVLVDLAQRKATSMQLRLAMHRKTGEQAPTLLSLGGPAPYEYCDGASRMTDNGAFSIGDARYVQAAQGDEQPPSAE